MVQKDVSDEPWRSFVEMLVVFAPVSLRNYAAKWLFEA